MFARVEEVEDFALRETARLSRELSPQVSRKERIQASNFTDTALSTSIGNEFYPH